MMKISALLVFLLCFTTVGLAFAQSQSTNTHQPPQVLVQIILRNSDGQLVGYVEGNAILSMNENLLNKYLDTISDKKLIVKDGKNYELIQFRWNTEHFTNYHAEAIYSLIPSIDGDYKDILDIKHSAYQVEPGDTISVFYTITRPV